MKTTRNVRAAAARAIATVINHGRSLNDALPAAQHQCAVDDRALLAELCYGTLRCFFELDALAMQLLQKPFKARDGDVHALLLTGLYQLRHMRIADHAAVTLTVEAARALHKDWAGKVLNGVLRNYLRQRESLDASIARHHNHPDWLATLIHTAWPDQANDIFAANNSQGGMTLRVNRLQYTTANYQQELADKGISSMCSPLAAEALLLQEPVPVNALPGFAGGSCSVQDLAAQLCAPLLALQPGLRALDACCAPGGKTGHILESEPQLGGLVAIDSDELRLQRVRENLQRLQLHATVLCADAADVSTWWDGTPFDRILLDAPCSGTGVIRRHPDIKHLRRANDIPALAQRQRSLLDALWPLLAPGGILLYTTCSILPQENEDIIAGFVQSHGDAATLSFEPGWGIPTGHGRQLLPAAQHDGFFYARLLKR